MNIDDLSQDDAGREVLGPRGGHQRIAHFRVRFPRDETEYEFPSANTFQHSFVPRPGDRRLDAVSDFGEELNAAGPGADVGDSTDRQFVIRRL